MSRPCVFFDRDGVVNQSPGPGYVERLEDFVLMEDILPVLRMVKKHGFAAVLVTNQRGVARGRMALETVNGIHEHLQEVLGEHDLAFLDVMLCPHDNGECTCRKPQPGMLMEAARRHDLDLSRSWMIGDSETDIEAGRRAGCRTILLSPASPETQADYRVSGLPELAGFLQVRLSPE